MSDAAKLRWKKWAGRAVLLLLLVLTFIARCHNRSQVFHHGGVFFLDGDCYSRMTRAKMVTEGQWIIRHHDFENWPEGITPHTTAPLDWLIVALKPAVDVAFKIADAKGTSVFRTQALDVAGALISPLLGVLTAAWLWWWGGKMRMQFRSAMVLLFALSRIAVHGTALGRPDHQSLLMLLLAVALGCELRLMRDSEQLKRRAWSIAAGCAWGSALWVSLYEPALLLAAVLLPRLFRGRKDLLSPERRWEWIALAAFFLLGILVDGWRIEMPGAALRENFARWSTLIGELWHLDPTGPLLWEWVGLLILAAPVLLCLAGREDRRAFVALGGVVLLFALTVWQTRWGCYLAVGFAMSVPWQLRAFRSTGLAWLAFAIGLLPVAMSWMHTLYPRGNDAERIADEQERTRKSQAQLRTFALLMKDAPRAGFIAAWWKSPQIAYWSGQPGVAGTSHQSLPGILDTARLFLSDDPSQEAEILRRRRVRWVIPDNSADVKYPDRLYVLRDSQTVLGLERTPEEPLAWVLAEHPQHAPRFLREMKPEELGLVARFTPKGAEANDFNTIKAITEQMHRIFVVMPEYFP